MYKRQVLFGLDLGEYDMEKSMEELSALAEANNMEAVGELVPVSYTHLDVYKRQMQLCADGPMPR